MRRALALAAAVLAARPVLVTAQQVEVTLAQAVQRALDVQPAVVQARGNVTNAGWQKRTAAGAFLPTLTFSSNAFRVNQQSVANGLPAQAGVYQYNTALSASLDLFTGFRRLARYRSA